MTAITSAALRASTGDVRPVPKGRRIVASLAIDSAAQAEEFVTWCKFAPRGSRGMNSQGCDADYSHKPPAQFCVEANRDNFVAIREEFWDAEGRPLKVLRGLDVQAVDLARGNWQAMRMEATNLQTNHRTLVRLENFKANQRLSDELFTTRHMEREL